MGDNNMSNGAENSDMDTYAHWLSFTEPIRRPVIRLAIQSLQLPTGTRGLDAGGGIGLQALFLAEAVGPEGQITILDQSPELLDCAKENIKKSGLEKRIFIKEGDITQLPYNDDSFDWAWSADCVGYTPLEPLPLVKELIRVVRPGGLIAILVWSSEQFLPGYPQLEAHLNATTSGIAPFLLGKKPELHFLRAISWFQEAGLKDIKVRTFAGDAQAPLSDDIRNALAALLQMRWPGVEAELSTEDAGEYQRLCSPDSPEFIIDQPDYYAFFTYTMFSGEVTE